MTCFEPCGCTCNELDLEFDSLVSSETQFGIELKHLLDSHFGWYYDDPELAFPDDLKGWSIARTPGVYILWRREGYCPDHDTEHLRAFYVGKAGNGVESRLKAHQARKRIGNGMSVEVSVWKAENRHSKYVEQLLLDLYNFPLNTAENRGTRSLCQHIPPAEWN